MFGIIGMDAAFVRAACARKKGGSEYYLSVKGSTTDPNIMLSCDGKIKITSTKNGSSITQSYTDLSKTVVSIQADNNTLITIEGDITYFDVFIYGSNSYQITELDITHMPNIKIIYIDGCNGLTSLDLSANTALTELTCSATGIASLDLSANIALTKLYCQSTGIASLDLSANIALTKLNCQSTGITLLDLSANIALTTLDCGYCSNLTVLNLSTNTLLTQLNCSSCPLNTIYYPANESVPSNNIKNAIQYGTVSDGTVYTDSEGAYYSTIADAATAKGWTIEQLQA